MKKEVDEKKTKAAPEKFFAAAVNEYFSFHKQNFRDQDGYALSPSWDAGKRGMEMAAMKKILMTLRGIAEGKGAEWTEERMKADLKNFMEKAMQHRLLKRDFLCCMMNRFKFDILSTAYHPNLSKKILEVWYYEFPDYTRDFEKDKAAAEVIIGFLKQQYVLSSVPWSEDSVVNSAKVIFNEVKQDEWWSKKSLKSISNNLQEFVNKIKSRKNGNSQTLRQGVMDELARRKY